MPRLPDVTGLKVKDAYDQLVVAAGFQAVTWTSGGQNVSSQVAAGAYNDGLVSSGRGAEEPSTEIGSEIGTTTAITITLATY